MEYQDFMEVTRKVMADQTPLPVTISIRNAWLLISGLQLTTRHPGLSDLMKKELESIARQFQGAITDLHTEAKECLEMGWKPEFDVEVDDDSDEIDDYTPPFFWEKYSSHYEDDDWDGFDEDDDLDDDDDDF